MERYYDRNGDPITDTLEWARLLEDITYQRVEETTLPDGTWISTVWLGLNHNYGDGPPLIFETVVFPKKGDFNDRDQDRYSTEAEAIAGHERMVEKYRVYETPSLDCDVTAAKRYAATHEQ
mgnify:CR=1 FL=1